MRPPRTNVGRAYIRRVRSTWRIVLFGRDIHVIAARTGDVRSESMGIDEHREMEALARRALHRNRQATVLADKLDAALAVERVLNNRNRRNKRHG